MKSRILMNTGLAALTTATMCMGGLGAMTALADDSSEVLIELSDDSILVDGDPISEDSSSAVYAGADIIYYEADQGSTYGAGGTDDEHSAEEAEAHTVITITQAGTYRVTGTLSAGQIAVDLGEDSSEDENAKVTLILDNADITCTVAPAVMVYEAYECGSDDTETASSEVDTSEAGFTLVLADDSENTVNGSYVAKIYKEGTTQEQVDSGEAKKAWKMDAAIESFISFNITAEEEGTGSLTVNAENEGIESSLHMTIDGGNITIQSADDAINASEDYVSVLTVNGGTIVANAGSGQEGDGIDSNGWVVINDGTVIASANGSSADSGLDSDMGIIINGGTVLASGNMYDEVSSDSAQNFLVLSFTGTQQADQTLLLCDSNEQAVAAFSTANNYSTLIYSSEDLAEGDYTLYTVSSVSGDQAGGLYTNITEYSDAVQLAYSSTGAAGFGGFGGFGGGRMNGVPRMGQAPEGMELPEGMEPPEGAQNGEQPADGQQNGEQPQGEQPADGQQNGEQPQGEQPADGQENGEAMSEQPTDGQQNSEQPQGEQPADGQQNGQTQNGQPDMSERPELPDGVEAPEGMELPEGMEFPENMQPGDWQQNAGASSGEQNTVFTVTAGGNIFSQISAYSEESSTEEAATEM